MNDFLYLLIKKELVFIFTYMKTHKKLSYVVLEIDLVMYMDYFTKSL